MRLRLRSLMMKLKLTNREEKAIPGGPRPCRLSLSHFPPDRAPSGPSGREEVWVRLLDLVGVDRVGAAVGVGVEGGVAGSPFLPSKCVDCKKTSRMVS